jgi:predicted nuclease with TOPRIM domain
LKGGRYNESESAKVLLNEKQQIMNEDMETIKAELDILRKENATLKVNSSKNVDMQSAMQSNNAAIQEKIETSNRLVKEKEAELNSIKDRIGQLEMENAQLREELSITKGRCVNLARDVEMHYNEMHKLNNDQSTAG